MDDDDAKETDEAEGRECRLGTAMPGQHMQKAAQEETGAGHTFELRRLVLARVEMDRELNLGWRDDCRIEEKGGWGGAGGAGTSPPVQQLSNVVRCVVRGDRPSCRIHRARERAEARTVQLVWEDALEGFHLVGLLLGVICSGGNERGAITGGQCTASAGLPQNRPCGIRFAGAASSPNTTVCPTR